MTNKELYTKICEQHPELPVFSKPWWLDVVCKDWDVVIASKGDYISGVWAYPIEQKAGVTLMRTPILTPYMGPFVFFPKDLKESNWDNYEHATIAELIKQIPKAKVWDLAIQPGIKQAGLFKANQLQSQVQQTFLIDLTKTEEVLIADMQDTMRRNIRQAQNEVTISNSPEYIGELYQFNKAVLAKKGRGVIHNLPFLQKLLDACTANNAGTLWTALDNENKVNAVVWQLWDAQCSYYFMGGNNKEANSYRSMSLLLWHSMKEAKNRGIVTFDLEGSMDEGVERFFRGFGGKRELYIVLKKNGSFIWKIKEMISQYK